MNLQPMNDPRPGQRVQCVECSKMVDAEQALCDMDGVPFKAYYHPDCVPTVQIWKFLKEAGDYYFWKYGYKGNDNKPVYQCTKEPKPPANDAGYYSFGYLLKVKGLLKGTTLNSIMKDLK